MRKVLSILVLSIILSGCNYAQEIYTDDDVKICTEKFDFSADQNLYSFPINKVMVEIGKTFLGTKYEAFTLEKGNHEQLVINLSGLDCYTFIEGSLALSRCIKKGTTDFESFKDEIKKLRYRNGKINKYPSRLHYASDWLYDNDKRGIVKNITKDIGGMRYSKTIDFMSKHSDSYSRLKDNPEFIEDILNIEDEITHRKNYYIPENYISCVENKIKEGDIIFMTASIKGLDISHNGIAVKKNDGKIYLMHAPMVGKRVQITEQPLAEYVKSLKRHTGIMVARPLEP